MRFTQQAAAQPSTISKINDQYLADEQDLLRVLAEIADPGDGARDKIQGWLCAYWTEDVVAWTPRSVHTRSQDDDLRPNVNKWGLGKHHFRELSYAARTWGSMLLSEIVVSDTSRINTGHRCHAKCFVDRGACFGLNALFRPLRSNCRVPPVLSLLAFRETALN